MIDGRYLWPLIHYHKFLAKCIKKLKRNGVDVKHAVSPVAVFLRDEVCAVSDHLAECSRFDSDEWMGCLKHFDGWTDCEGEDQLRQHIRLLKLRPLSEPGDVDSKLLRDQVDRHFLTAMAKARAQLREGGEAPIIRSREGSSRPRGQPPVYPRHALNPEATPVSRNGYRRNSSPGLYNYHDFNPYWNTGDQSSMSSMVTQPSAVPYGDNSSVQSVQSVLSSESGFVQNNYPAYMHPVAAHPHAYPHYYAGHMPYHHPNKFGEYPMNGTECIDPAYYGALFYPSYQTPMAHGIPSEVEEQHDEDVSEGTDLDLPSTSESEAEKKDSTPVKYQMQPQQQSPFWSHLDSVATGLATPAKASPKTPRQNVSPEGQPVEQFHHTSAQPLLLRGYPYYGNYMAREGYAPPSPATQFMMSPQPNFAPGYGYPYGLSPGGARSPRKKMSSRNAGETTPPPVRKIVATHDVSRESPTTVGTSAETESLPEGAAV